MASGPATPPAEEPPDGAERAGAEPPRGGPATAAAPASEERYGPLALLRTHKDDGRSLILFSVAVDRRADAETVPAEPPPAAGEQGRRT